MTESKNGRTFVQGNVWNYWNDDMYKEYNCNPQGLNTKDCVYRALSLFLDKDWKEIAEINMNYYLETGRFLWNVHRIESGRFAIPIANLNSYLSSLGYHDIIPDLYGEPGYHRIPKILADYPEMKKGRFLFLNGIHAITMVDGVIHDSGPNMVANEYARCYAANDLTLIDGNVIPK